MLSNKVKELIRIRNILINKDALVSLKDIHILDTLITLPTSGEYHSIVDICNKEIEEIRACFI